MKFYEWDYSTGEVIEYRREGECLQCGECCRALVRFSFTKPGRCKNPRNGGATTSGKGIWQEVNHGRWSYFYKIEEVKLTEETCYALTDAGLCEKHAEKDHVCADWPFSPRCIEPFTACGYDFQEIGQWRIDDCESKHNRA